MIKKMFFLFVVTIFLCNCNGMLEKTPDDKFIGLWEVRGTEPSNGILINIQKENGKLIGRIHKLNNNKYVKLFVDSNDIFISKIERISNYQFKITENKIGSELFSTYGLKTEQEYKVQFIDTSTIGLALENSNILSSKKTYKKVDNIR